VPEIGPLPDWDPEIQPFIAGGPESQAGVDEVVAAVRARRGHRLPDDELNHGGAFEVSERSIESKDGRTVGLTIVTPTRERKRGAIYWLHGGAQVGGAPVSFDVRFVLDIALEFSLVVVAADFALAPEHPAPAGLDDAFAGFAWTAASAAELGYPEGALFLHGLSGGAGLAAGAALLARDSGLRYAGLVLDGPMLDDRCVTPSVQQIGPVVAGSLRVLWDYILKGTTGDVPAEIGYAVPGRLVDEDLSGLPPAYIASGANDPCRDETTAFAAAIWRSGGVADLHQWAGTRHGADLLAPDAHVSQEAIAGRVAWYRRIVSRLEAHSAAASSTDAAVAG
jgi:acetyl esterase/lipase